MRFFGSQGLRVVCVAGGDRFAESIIGRASVLDGDRIEIHGYRIRLRGIDALESGQLCSDDSATAYRCGRVAAFALDDFLKSARPTTCHKVDWDRYGQMVARCTAGGKDVAEWLVRNGHALDWPKFSKGAYAVEQAEARRARAGMWQGEFVERWKYRKQHRRPGI